MTEFAVFLDFTSASFDSLLRTGNSTVRHMRRRNDLPSFGERLIICESDDQGKRVGAVTMDGWVAIGHARLDDAEPLRRHLPQIARGKSDLELVVASFALHREKCLSHCVGDFSIALFDSTDGTLYGLRDALGVYPLFYRQQQQGYALSSAIRMLSYQAEYDTEYLGEYLVEGHGNSDRTVFSGIRRVPPGAVARVEKPGDIRFTAYWSPEQFERSRRGPIAELATECRQLIDRAIITRIEPQLCTWAHLSGGLDSSGIVCAAHSLFSRGALSASIAGTLTYVDSLCKGDERLYVDLVSEQTRIPNTQLVDYAPWDDDGVLPPLTDEPHPHYPFYARERRAAHIMDVAGVDVLLGGYGPDHYLFGNLNFMADLIAGGHVIKAVKTIASFATAKKVSFWKYAYRWGIDPLMPRALRHNSSGRDPVPRWIDANFARRYDLRGRTATAKQLMRGPRRLFDRPIAFHVKSFARGHGPFASCLGPEMRFPFLHRPLVEFALQLTPDCLIQPFGGKWIQRLAFEGTLPDTIRLRQGKGGVGGRVRWALLHKSDLIDDLLADPILGDLGCIDPSRLRAAIRRTQASYSTHGTRLLSVLALETWLRVRAGRWTVRQNALRIAG